MGLSGPIPTATYHCMYGITDLLHVWKLRSPKCSWPHLITSCTPITTMS